MLNIKKDLFSFKNTFFLLKNIFRFCCLIVFIYQFIEITNNYLSFPIEIKLNISDENAIDLPSVTFCLSKSKSWNKKNSTDFDSYSSIKKSELLNSSGDEDNNHTFNQIFDQSIDLSSAIDCSVALIVNENKFYNKCEKIGRNSKFISSNSHYGK
jgi:hypothetical protein